MTTEEIQLQPAERDTLNSLRDAWSKWLTLPNRHPDSDAEMRHAIHTAQFLIAGLVAKRANPEVWWSQDYLFDFFGPRSTVTPALKLFTINSDRVAKSG